MVHHFRLFAVDAAAVVVEFGAGALDQVLQLVAFGAELFDFAGGVVVFFFHDNRVEAAFRCWCLIFRSVHS